MPYVRQLRKNKVFTLSELTFQPKQWTMLTPHHSLMGSVNELTYLHGPMVEKTYKVKYLERKTCDKVDVDARERLNIYHMLQTIMTYTMRTEVMLQQRDKLATFRNTVVHLQCKAVHKAVHLDCFVDCFTLNMQTQRSCRGREKKKCTFPN